MKLHLGVLVQPYELYGRGQTTGEVAEILEDQYGIMGTWWDIHGQEVADDMESGLKESVEAMMEGRAVRRKPFGTAMNNAETSFKQFLSTGAVELAGIPGVPTKSALKGVRHRRKHPYAKANPRRPSFVDSGLYENSFKAWID